MNLADLYDDVCTMTMSAPTPAVERTFISSLKMVIHDLNQRLKENVIPPAYVSSIDIGFEDYCDSCFHAGVKYYGQRLGAWAQDPDSESFNLYQAELKKVIGRAIDATSGFATRNEE